MIVGAILLGKAINYIVGKVSYLMKVKADV